MPRKHNTLSAFVIGETTKQQALLYTAQNSRLNSLWQIIEVKKLTYTRVRSSDCNYPAL